METRFIRADNFAKRLMFGALFSLSALFIYGLAEANSPKLRLFKEKNNSIIVELVHKPKNENRWIVLIGENNSTTIPYNTNSTSQSDGENCAIVHRWLWRSVPQLGTLSVEAHLVDGKGTRLEWAQAKIILGPMEEQ